MLRLTILSCAFEPLVNCGFSGTKVLIFFNCDSVICLIGVCLLALRAGVLVFAYLVVVLSLCVSLKLCRVVYPPAWFQVPKTKISMFSAFFI